MEKIVNARSFLIAATASTFKKKEGTVPSTPPTPITKKNSIDREATAAIDKGTDNNSNNNRASTSSSISSDIEKRNSNTSMAPRFADHFWGDKDLGFEVLYNHMRIAKTTCKEIEEIIAERAKIEEEYAKSLAKLAKRNIAKDEIGTMKDTINVIKMELDQTAQTHMNLAAELRTKIDKPLTDFINEQSTQRKNKGKVVEKLLKTKHAQRALVAKTKKNMELKQKELQQLEEQLSKATKDADKINTKKQKAAAAAENAEREYHGNVEKLKQITAQWEEEMRSACDIFQKLEEERFSFLRESVWEASTTLSTACAADDQSCERIRNALEKLDADADLTQFVSEKGTGDIVPAYDAVGETSGFQRYTEKSNLSMPSLDSPQANSGSKVSNQLFTVTVVYDYEPQGEEELELAEGEVLPVISIDEDPWWEGVKNGRSGMFPSNFVRKN